MSAITFMTIGSMLIGIATGTTWWELACAVIGSVLLTLGVFLMEEKVS